MGVQAYTAVAAKAITNARRNTFFIFPVVFIDVDPPFKLKYRTEPFL
jgi:hypothetical protein